jgi:hypothetical protein
LTRAASRRSFAADAQPMGSPQIEVHDDFIIYPL